MTKVKIDKGVPLPDTKMGNSNKYPWLEMEVGDSFAATTQQLVSLRANITHRNQRYKDRHFVIRKFENGYRVWRDK